MMRALTLLGRDQDVGLTSYPNHMTEVRLICKHLDNKEDLVKAFGRSM